MAAKTITVTIEVLLNQGATLRTPFAFYRVEQT